MPSSSDCSLLGLPREVRDQIYTSLFQSLTFDANEPQYGAGEDDPRLAILRVCRQTYAEAGPLVLRHVRVGCRGASDMLRALMAMSAAQVRQLRHLRVEFDMLRLNLPRASGGGDDDDDDVVPHGFHVGALLGLFPGLALHRLELVNGMHEGLDAYRAHHAADVVSSLLRADGYREARAVFDNLGSIFPGSFADRGQESFRTDAAATLDTWADLIGTRFRPRPGARVELYVDKTAPADDGYWDRHGAAGLALVDGLAAREEARCDGRDEGHDELRYWNFRAYRGEGPFAVPESGDEDEEAAPVLECVQAHPMSADELRAASTHLRRLVRAGDWAAIELAQEESGMEVDGPYGEEALW